MDKPLEAFIFDLDGVITDTAEYHYLAWRELGEDLGIPFSREFNEELKGVSRMDSLEKILALGGRENDFSEEEKAALASKKNEHYVALIQNITPADILPGIEKVLKDIKNQGLKLGLASVSKNAFTVIESLGLNQYFDSIVDASTIKKGKPDPEIFLRAAELLEVKPWSCIGVEDAYAGIEAIKGAGMFAVGIGSRETLSKADLIYKGTDQLNLQTIIDIYQKA